MNPSEYLEVAYRAWTGAHEKPKPKRAANYPPRRLLVIDTETTTDTGQSLIFGFARLARIWWNRRDDGTYTCCQHETETEVLFHADHLESTDPAGYELLKDYAHAHSIPIVSRSVFMEEYVRRYCLARSSPKGNTLGEATITGFNLPFDLSRLAYGYGAARNGGFSFTMFPPWQGKENQYRPRLVIKALDSKKSIIQWTRDNNGQLNQSQLDMRRGQFLDLRQLIWGMTNIATSLRGACEMFGLPGEYTKSRAEEYGKITPEFIAYARQDVLATTELAVTVLSEYMRHPIGLQATKVFSAASIAKAYLREMGITPMLTRNGVPSDARMMGRCVTAFYGGRAEAHIRGTVVPVTVCDFTSMYPTVNALMRLWDHVTAQGITALEGAAELQRFTALAAHVATAGVKPLLDRAVWPYLTGFAQVVPDGDVLPVRARYGGQSWNVGVNAFYSREPAWYTMADVLASSLLTGKVPKIIDVIRFAPDAAKLAGLETVKLGGTVPVDPAHDDFFRTVVEQRAAIKGQIEAGKAAAGGRRAAGALKVLANSGSYGIYVEMLRDDECQPADVTAWGIYDEPWPCKPNAVETAREFCYPPIGAVITGAARLMLAMVERLVTDRGGSWLFCDTDSMAIITNHDGSLIPCDGGNHRMLDGRAAVKALTRAEIQDIRDTVNTLNPYDRGKVPELLKDETADTNYEGQVYGYALSAKRYCLFTYDADGRSVVPDKIDGKDAYMQHALGLYLNPADTAKPEQRDWIRQTWQHIIDKAHGLNPPDLPWSGLPALCRITVSTPHIMRAFRSWNDGKSYDDGIKPFNFVLLASEFRGGFGLEDTAQKLPLRLLAPYESNPARWPELKWCDLNDSKAAPARITTAFNGKTGQVRVKSHAAVLTQYECHPEAKSAMLDGNPCDNIYGGVLSRRIVRPLVIRHIGKESNRVDDMENGSIADLAEVFTGYDREDRTPIIAALDGLSARQVAELVNRESAMLLERETCYFVNADGISLAEHRKTRGHPVKVNHMMIRRYFKGSVIRDKRQEQAIVRAAAKHVAASIGIDPEKIGYGKRLVSPETVLATWGDTKRQGEIGVVTEITRLPETLTL